MEVSPEQVKQWLDSGVPVSLVDVREPFEHAIARIDAAELIPMNTVPDRLADLRAMATLAPLAVLCHHGVRSLNVVNWLRRQGVENTYSIAGGIDCWSLTIDPAVPRY